MVCCEYERNIKKRNTPTTHCVSVWWLMFAWLRHDTFLPASSWLCFVVLNALVVFCLIGGDDRRGSGQPL